MRFWVLAALIGLALPDSSPAHFKIILTNSKSLVFTNGKGKVVHPEDEGGYLIDAEQKDVIVRTWYGSELRVDGAQVHELSDAIVDLTGKIRRNPSDASLYKCRGIVWRISDLENQDIAIADFNESLRLAPMQADVYIQRGIAFLNKKMFDNALDDFESALRLTPDSAWAHFLCGIAWTKLTEDGDVSPATLEKYREYKKVIDAPQVDLTELKEAKHQLLLQMDLSVNRNKQKLKESLANYDEAIRQEPLALHYVRNFHRETAASYKDIQVVVEDVRKASQKPREPKPKDPVKPKEHEIKTDPVDGVGKPPKTEVPPTIKTDPPGGSGPPPEGPIDPKKEIGKEKKPDTPPDADGKKKAKINGGKSVKKDKSKDADDDDDDDGKITGWAVTLPLILGFALGAGLVFLTKFVRLGNSPPPIS